MQTSSQQQVMRIADLPKSCTLGAVANAFGITVTNYGDVVDGVRQRKLSITIPFSFQDDNLAPAW